MQRSQVSTRSDGSQIGMFPGHPPRYQKLNLAELSHMRNFYTKLMNVEQLETTSVQHVFIAVKQHDIFISCMYMCIYIYICMKYKCANVDSVLQYRRLSDLKWQQSLIAASHINSSSLHRDCWSSLEVN